MLVAKWADDIRDSPSFNRPKWHYINYPLVFDSRVPTREPDPDNIVSAFMQSCSNIKTANTSDSDKAISLSWIFHLVGDVHQPLHTTAFYSSEFPAGDRGGNAFEVIASEGGRTIYLHTFWDGLIIGSENFQQVKNQAILIRNNPALQRNRLSELKVKDFSYWAKNESFAIARDSVYEKGSLKTGSTLSQQYRDKAKAIGERRIALAGYRLADVLVDMFENWSNRPGPILPADKPATTSSASVIGNKNSRIYHLPNCPSYSQVSPQNRVSFKTEEEAQRAGYRKAKNCP